jgi:hypothetical protein
MCRVAAVATAAVKSKIQKARLRVMRHLDRRYLRSVRLLVAARESHADPANGFVCSGPEHHDGDAIRCDGRCRSMRLYGIDAPEMPGACRPGRQCTPAPPLYLPRPPDMPHGRPAQCSQVDTDTIGALW